MGCNCRGVHGLVWAVCTASLTQGPCQGLLIFGHTNVAGLPVHILVMFQPLHSLGQGPVT